MNVQNPFSRPRFRRICLGGVAVTGGAALLITSLPAFAEDEEPPYAASCEVTILPGAEGTDQALIRATDETGTYFAGQVEGEETSAWPVVWHDGEVTPIDFSATGEEFTTGYVRDINANGDTVGYGHFEGFEGRQPFATVDGEAMLLSLPDGWKTGQRSGINDDGVIVGHAEDENGESMPLRWETADSEPEVLSLPDDALSGTAQDIDNEGQIVGSYATGPDGDRDVTAYLWDADGEGQALTEDTYAMATSVNGEWVGGNTQLGPLAGTGMRWHNGEAEEVDMHSLHDINGQGDVVGDWSYAVGRDRAAKYTADGELYMLPFPERDGQSDAYTVSGDGTTIAGWISDTRDNELLDYTPAVWHCAE